jgi:molybdenum cofactor cytidylyltransferase
MRFGPVSVSEAEGGLLAHSLPLPGARLKKGRLLSAEDVAAIAAAGIATVTVAMPEAGDIDENAAAARLGAALVGDGAETGLRLDPAFTGRANLRATGPGIVEIDTDAIHRLNAIDPAITLATLPQWQRVAEGTMVGTVKMIAYAVAKDRLEAACRAGAGAIRRRAPVLRDADLLVTRVAGMPAGRDDKGIAAVEGRLAALGIALRAVEVVAHETPALAAALGRAAGDLSLILTGSATSDARDVGPAALEMAGGRLLRFGMPVDPGNLLFLGEIGARPVIGLPGCARSPALNGADWVLERVACGVPVSAGDIAAMGVGGLLKEIPTRPQPRDGPRK